MNRHAVIDARSLAFGRAIAVRLRNNPELVDVAKATLSRWLTTCSPRSRPTLVEWQTVLDGPFEDVLALLESPSERATRLRQSNPFGGILPPAERNAILLQFSGHDAVSA